MTNESGWAEITIMLYHRCRALLLALSLCLAWVLTVSAADSGTLVLKTGERIEVSRFSVDQVYKVLKYQLNGKKMAVSFADIDTILDRSGRDVTAETLGGQYHKPAVEKRENWLEAGSKVYRKGLASPWHLAVRVGGNYTFPTSYYYDGITSGVGFGGDVVLPLNSYLALRGSVSLAGSQLENDFVSIEPGFELVSNDLDIDVWRYLFGLQYYAPFSHSGFDKGHWFIYTGLGATSNSFSGSIMVRDIATGDLYVAYGSGNETKFTINSTVGGTSMFSRWGGIEYSASVDLLFIGTAYDRYGNKQMQNAANIDLRLGLVLVVPRHNEEND